MRRKKCKSRDGKEGENQLQGSWSNASVRESLKQEREDEKKREELGGARRGGRLLLLLDP